MDSLFLSADPDVMAQERRKAKLLKQSAWWKNCRGKGVCAYCGKRVPPKELTMDHKIPIVRGGRSTRGNCVPACPECNQQKKNIPAGMWQASLEKNIGNR